jgi:tRNA pseudouridine38-40 synthase
VFRPLDLASMNAAAQCLIGEHDFSAFRSSQCQASSPVRQLRRVAIERHGEYWRFEFDATAFLHHMVRNVLGCLVAVGTGTRPQHWLAEVLASRRRELAAPTFAPDGLYFRGPYYPASFEIPERVPAVDWLP